MGVKNLRNGTMIIQDGAATPQSITLTLDTGDLSWEETDNLNVVRDRGDLSGLTKGDEEPVTGSFSIKFQQFIKQSFEADPTAYEALKNIGAAASWATTDPNNCGTFATRIIFEIASCVAGESSERITFEKVHLTKNNFEEGDENNTLSFEFLDNEIAPTVVKF